MSLGPRSRRALRGLGAACGVALVLALSLVLHLATPLGHAAAADAFGAILTSRIRGTAHVDAVTQLGIDLEMRGFTVTAPSGERVIAADRMATHFDLGASLRRGAVVLTPTVLEGGEMRVTRGPGGQIALVDAMEVPDDRVMIPVEIADIRLQHQTMVMALPPIAGSVTMANVSGLVDMSLGHEFRCRMDRVHGYVNIPVVHVGFHGLNGQIVSDSATPLDVRMALDLEVADPTMEIRYRAPGAVGREGAPGTSISLGADVPDEGHVATSRRRRS